MTSVREEAGRLTIQDLGSIGELVAALATLVTPVLDLPQLHGQLIKQLS